MSTSIDNTHPHSVQHQTVSPNDPAAMAVNPNVKQELSPQLQTWLDWALWYASRGLPVFPLAPRSKKTIKGTRGHHEATTDEAQIRRWAETFEASGQDTPNLAIAPPEGVIVVDIDPVHGGDKTAETLPLTPTLEQRTGSGGSHALYRVPEDANRQPKEPWKGINIKGNGRGYIVVHPSIHPNGNQYQWINPTAAIEPAPEFVTSVCSGGTTQKVEPSPLLRAPRKLPDEAASQVASVLAGELVDGNKHNAIVAFGQWCLGRELSASDAHAIVDEALSQTSGVDDHEAGCDAALWAYRNGIKGGYAELSELLANGRTALEAMKYHVVAAAGPTVEEQHCQGVREVVERWRQQDALASGAVQPTAENPWTLKRVGEVNTDADWICKGLQLARGEVTALVGEPGTAKTPFAALIALCASNGEPFLERPVKKLSRVLWVAAEKERDAHRKLASLAQGHALTTDGVDILCLPDDLSNPKSIAELKKIIRERQHGLVVIDTYGAALSGDVDRNASGASATLRKLSRDAELSNVAWVPILHCNKGTDGSPQLRNIDGHNSIAGALNGAIGLSRSSDGEVKVSCVREISEGFAPFRASIARCTGDGELSQHLTAGWRISELDSDSDPPKAANEKPKKKQTKEEQLDKWAEQAEREVLEYSQQNNKRMLGTELLAKLKGGSGNDGKTRKIKAVNAALQKNHGLLKKVDEYGFDWRGASDGDVYYEHVNWDYDRPNLNDCVLGTYGFRPQSEPQTPAPNPGVAHSGQKLSLEGVNPGAFHSP